MVANSLDQSAPQPERRPCDLLIRNGRVQTLGADGALHAPGAVAVGGRHILAVGGDEAVAHDFDAARVIDAEGGLVHPGLVEAHYHATMHLTRGTLPDHAPVSGEGARASFGGFSRWMNALEDEDEYASALLASVEMARNGVTCFMDPGTSFAPGAVAAAAEAVGIRASVADPFLWDVEGGLGMASEIDRAPPSAERAFGLLGSELWRNRDPDALIRGHVALYGSGSASEELTAAAKARADEAGVVLTQHQNLDPADADFDEARFGRHGLVHFAEQGLLGPNCTFMHMNVLRDDEVAAVADAGMSVVWHPGNYLYYAISAAVPSPMVRLLSRGVTVAFGTDLAKAWTFGDLGLLGYLVARMGGEFLSADEILAMQTRSGARAVGLEDRIGTLEPGKRADLVIRTTAIPEMQPGFDPVREAVLVARSKSVDMVICDGEIVVEGGRLTRLDEDTAYSLAVASAKRMVARLGL